MSARERTPLVAAARLAHPWRPEPLDRYGSDELVVAAGTLRRHKVSVMGLRHTHGNAVLDTALAPFVEEDRARYRREREEFEGIRRRFAEDGIDAMLFKSAGLFPSFHYLSSNLDVIVPPGRVDAARRHLVDAGYVELLNVEEPQKFLFRRFPGDGSSFAFHLHEVVGWGVPFLDNATLWEGARPAPDDPDVLIPAPREALLVTLAHWFYEDKELSLGNMLLTANALRDYEGTLADAAAPARARGWEEGFWGALDVFDRAWRRAMDEPALDDARRSEVGAALRRYAFMRDDILAQVHYGSRVPATIPFLRNKLAYYRKVLRDPGRGRWQRARDVVATLLWAVRWKLHLRSQRPLLVSVSGCDGSGKTVHVERLASAFDACDVRRRFVWARGASSRFVAPLLWIGKRLAGGRGGGVAGDAAGDAAGGEAERFRRRQAALSRPLARNVFAFVFALDLAWTYGLVTRLRMLAGNVVICDRYVYDALVDYTLFTGVDLDAVPRPLRWLERLAPRPHVRLLLDVDPEEALRRKPEEGDATHLAAARDAFARVAASRGLDTLPADERIEEIQRRIARLALDAFYRRYGTLLNALLWSNPSQLNPRPGVR